MTSTVILTPEIREIPYFSSFSQNEESVTIPRPLINEAITYTTIELESIKTEDLITIVENRIYLNMNTDNSIMELLWRFGETHEKLRRDIKKLSSIIQLELEPYLSKVSIYEVDSDRYVFYGIRCMIEIEGQLENTLCEKAAYYGNLRLLKWARKNGYPWNESTCAEAALTGCLEILKWARENGCPWNIMVCKHAACNGRLEILKWARENGCPWDETICSYAAAYGYLDVLKWARENGCPWNKRTLEYAEMAKHSDIIKWCKDNNCPT